MFLEPHQKPNSDQNPYSLPSPVFGQNSARLERNSAQQALARMRTLARLVGMNRTSLFIRRRAEALDPCLRLPVYGVGAGSFHDHSRSHVGNRAGRFQSRPHDEQEATHRDGVAVEAATPGRLRSGARLRAGHTGGAVDAGCWRNPVQLLVVQVWGQQQSLARSECGQHGQPHGRAEDGPVHQPGAQGKIDPGGQAQGDQGISGQQGGAPPCWPEPYRADAARVCSVTSVYPWPRASLMKSLSSPMVC